MFTVVKRHSANAYYSSLAYRRFTHARDEARSDNELYEIVELQSKLAPKDAMNRLIVPALCKTLVSYIKGLIWAFRSGLRTSVHDAVQMLLM